MEEVYQSVLNRISGLHQVSDVEPNVLWDGAMVEWRSRDLVPEMQIDSWF